MTYKNNERIQKFFEYNAEMFAGIQKFITIPKTKETIHEIEFMDEEIADYFQHKLRNVNYKIKPFKYTDFKIENESDKNIKLVYQQIRGEASDFKTNKKYVNKIIRNSLLSTQ